MEMTATFCGRSKDLILTRFCCSWWILMVKMEMNLFKDKMFTWQENSLPIGHMGLVCRGGERAHTCSSSKAGMKFSLAFCAIQTLGHWVKCFRNSTCIAWILPNCWDCSQSESRTHSRPKADLPTISKSTESLVKVMVLICPGGSTNAQWSSACEIKPNQPQQEIQSIKGHWDFLRCLKSVSLDGGVKNSWPHWLFSHFVNYESSNASSIVDDGMKGRGLLLLGVPLVPLVPI